MKVNPEKVAYSRWHVFVNWSGVRFETVRSEHWKQLPTFSQKSRLTSSEFTTWQVLRHYVALISKPVKIWKEIELLYRRVWARRILVMIAPAHLYHWPCLSALSSRKICTIEQLSWIVRWYLFTNSIIILVVNICVIGGLDSQSTRLCTYTKPKNVCYIRIWWTWVACQITFWCRFDSLTRCTSDVNLIHIWLLGYVHKS